MRVSALNQGFYDTVHVRHPVWIRRVGTPGAEAFAILFTLESLSRALLATVIPLEAFALLGSAQRVSILFFAVGVIGLCGSFAVPWLVRRTARRWVYSLGALLMLLACALLAVETIPAQAAGMATRALSVVSITICVNLYIMDNIARRDFGRAEPMRIFYSAGAWTLGPALGVMLSIEVAPWAPYALSAAFALAMLGYFWFLRMTDSPGLMRPRGRVSSPLSNLRGYFSRPRLVLAWLISASRNSWWAVFFIYTPIYAVQSGLGEFAGGSEADHHIRGHQAGDDPGPDVAGLAAGLTGVEHHLRAALGVREEHADHRDDADDLAPVSQ